MNDLKKIGKNPLIPEFTLDDAKVGESVTLRATVHKFKDMGGFAFVNLRTGRYVLQAVYSPDTCSDSTDDIYEGVFAEVTADVKEEPRAA
ncbi:MAG: hypothetical protein LBL87_03185 [Ruminococcus sp.]|nr:hypothetical protein [Ruminococcus sp.]